MRLGHLKQGMARVKGREGLSGGRGQVNSRQYWPARERDERERRARKGMSNPNTRFKGREEGRSRGTCNTGSAT